MDDQFDFDHADAPPAAVPSARPVEATVCEPWRPESGVPLARPVDPFYVPDAPARPRVWSPWLGLLCFFTCGTLFVLSQVAAVLAVGIERAFAWALPLTAVGQILTMALLPIAFVRLTGGATSRALSLARPSRRLLAALVPLLLVWPVASQLMSQYLATMLPPEPDQLDFMRELLIWRSPAHAVSVIVCIAAVPAICEELLFRGLLLTSLRRLLGDGSAIVVTAVLFALVHVPALIFIAPQAALGMLLPLTFLGLALTLLAARTGTIVYASALHFVNNLLALLLANLLPDDLLPPAVRSGVVVVSVTALSVGALAWWLAVASPKDVERGVRDAE